MVEKLESTMELSIAGIGSLIQANPRATLIIAGVIILVLYLNRKGTNTEVTYPEIEKLKKTETTTTYDPAYTMLMIVLIVGAIYYLMNQ